MKATLATQVSCYIKNIPGAIGKICRELALEEVNIEGLLAIEGQLEQLLRFVPNDLEASKRALKKAGVDLVSFEDVIRVPLLADKGTLSKFASTLGNAGINIDSLYFSEYSDMGSVAFVSVHDKKKTLEVINELGERNFMP